METETGLQTSSNPLEIYVSTFSMALPEKFALRYPAMPAIHQLGWPGNAL